jgi:hypothetical protein
MSSKAMLITCSPLLTLPMRVLPCALQCECDSKYSKYRKYDCDDH